MNDEQMVNVVGALALHIADQIREQTDLAAQHGAAAPSALVSISNHPGETIDYLRQVLGMTHSGTVRLVERLVAARLITKRAGGDARSVALECTTTGHKRAQRTIEARRKVIVPLVNALSEEQRVQFDSILRKLPWTGVATKIEALRTCRLCQESCCVANGDCPVMIARTTPTRELGQTMRKGRAKQPISSAVLDAGKDATKRRPARS